MEPQNSHRAVITQMLMHPGTMATILYSIAVREFGAEVHEWEPETVYMEIKDSFGIEMPEANFNKLMALICAVSSDAFYQKWGSFETICAALSDGDASGDDELLVGEMAWGVIEVKLNDDTPGEFSAEVAAGVGALLMNEGFTAPPPSLAFARKPDEYVGDSDQTRKDAMSSEHEAVVQEFVRDQALLLSKQLSAVPWLTKPDLESVLTQI